MSTPSLSDRILAALSQEPMTESDLHLAFSQRVHIDAIRQKLAALHRTGRVIVGNGVWSLARGVVTPVKEAEDEDEPEAPAVTVKGDTQHCPDSDADLPLHAFGRTAGGTRRKICRVCQGRRIAAGHKRANGVKDAAERERVAADAVPADARAFSVEVKSVDDTGEPIATIRRTTMLTVKDCAGILRSVQLDDAGVMAVLAALQPHAA